MKIIRMVQFEDSDASALRRLMELANQAAAFFQDKEQTKIEMSSRAVMPVNPDSVKKPVKAVNGLWVVNRLTAGHPMPKDYLLEALKELQDAEKRIELTQPSDLFPSELRQRYLENMKEAKRIVSDSLIVAMWGL